MAVFAESTNGSAVVGAVSRQLSLTLRLRDPLERNIVLVASSISIVVCHTGAALVSGPDGVATWCSLCDQGQYNDGVSQPSKTAGECKTCNSTAYSAVVGQAECTSCPLHAVNLLASGLTRLADCTCEEGTWRRPEGHAPTSLFTCPWCNPLIPDSEPCVFSNGNLQDNWWRAGPDSAPSKCVNSGCKNGGCVYGYTGELYVLCILHFYMRYAY
jgi:hypothetical protein